MLFNSLSFIFFFIIITTLYFQLPHKYRWFLLLAASCYFYMYFVPVYILILGFTIVVDYFAGKWIERSKGSKRKLLLIMSLVANIGVLAFFKYYNFFLENLIMVAGLSHEHSPLPFLKILLPIGLSFHTFQAMSYTIEVYRGNQKAEHHFGIYALYVMFYPQLVAGPIERPQNLLHQFREKHPFDHDRFKSGLMLMGWGFFKKVVIADRLAIMVDVAYANADSSSGMSLLLATIFYAFQIYCDFSGYSDIAIGAARIMGFDLMLNFRTPYFAKSIAEFWKRWHISLSTWFRDYLYIPLGGNRVSVPRWYFNLFIVFLLSGIWHGANWTFVIWGALHGLYLIVGILKDKAVKKFNLKINNKHWASAGNILITFSLVTFAWIFFRAPSVSEAFTVISRIGHLSFTDPIVLGLNTAEILFSVLLIIILLFKEKFFEIISTKNNFSFYAKITLLLFICYLFGVFNQKQFIYFQF